MGLILHALFLYGVIGRFSSVRTTKFFFGGVRNHYVIQAIGVVQ